MSPAIFLTHHSRVWNNTLAVLAIVLPVSPALPRVDTWSPMSFSITFFFPTQSGAIVHQRTYANAQRNAPLIQTQQLYKDWQQSQDSPSCSPNTGGQRFPHNHNIGPKCWEFCPRNYWLYTQCLTNRLRSAALKLDLPLRMCKAMHHRVGYTCARHNCPTQSSLVLWNSLGIFEQVWHQAQG